MRVAADGVWVVQVRTDDPAAAACPACGVFSATVRQRRTTRPRDLPDGESPLRVRWHKVQYACREAGCPLTAFTEQIPEVPARVRVTGRLRRHVARLVADGAAVSTACAELMSWPVAHRAWVAHAEARLAEPSPVRVLGIDETDAAGPPGARTRTPGSGWPSGSRRTSSTLPALRDCSARPLGAPRAPC
ncbi:MAG TPA: transposase family protein [Gemmatimonadales bacterium]|nr:transposase family protein [Gemmatimonadales bacterium]